MAILINSPVFSCSVNTCHPFSSLTRSFHFSFSMSTDLKPVRKPNLNALATLGFLHNSSSNSVYSSRVTYSLFLRLTSIATSKPSNGLVLMYRSLTASLSTNFILFMYVFIVDWSNGFPNFDRASFVRYA